VGVTAYHHPLRVVPPRGFVRFKELRHAVGGASRIRGRRLFGVRTIPAEKLTPQTATNAQSGGRKRLPQVATAAPSLARRALPWIAVPVGLSFVTYTATGYAYQVWPQFFLQYPLRYSGKLRDDWATSFPPTNWAFTHLLALVPSSALSAVVFALWAFGLVGLWLAFASLCRALGVTWLGVVGAGLLAASTNFAGLGLSQPVTGFLYPTNLAFALIIAALAAMFHSRITLAGAFLGLATLVHPQVGILAAPVVVVGALFLGMRSWRRFAAFFVAFLIPAALSIYMVLTQQALGSNLSSHQQYELFAVVRAPWHFLYRAFSTMDYAVSLSWAVVLAAALLLLRARRNRGGLAVMFGACVVICSLGALASQIGWPLFLVQIQTARLSSLVILLAIVAAAAAISQFIGAWTGPTLMLVALLTPLVRDGLLTYNHFRSISAALVSTSSVEAGTALVLILGLAWATSKGSAIAPSSVAPRVVQFAFVCTLAVTAVSLIGPYQTARALTSSQVERDWIAVGERAKLVSNPTDQVLVPPDQDLFALSSDRPVVVTFGSFEFAAGASQWVQRIIAITGNPHVLDPSPPMTVMDRLSLMASWYDQTVAHSAAPICRYKVKFVVVGSSVPPPPWLSLVEKTQTYALYKVSRPPCPPSSRS
jgi:hypothetical protein